MMPIELIELKGGLIVNAASVCLALDLERRGHTMTVREGTLYVKGGTLTPDDRVAIKRLRMHLMAIAAYEPPPVSQLVISYRIED